MISVTSRPIGEFAMRSEADILEFCQALEP